MEIFKHFTPTGGIRQQDGTFQFPPRLILEAIKLSPSDYAKFIVALNHNFGAAAVEKLIATLAGVTWEQEEYKFPQLAKHDGKVWFFTGKSGRNFKTNRLSGEYSYGGNRVWIDTLGNINPD